MLASLDRHLREEDAAFSIAKDIEFSNCRKVLEGKERLPCQQGFGKRPNAAKAMNWCGTKECFQAILLSHWYRPCGSCSPSTLVWGAVWSTRNMYVEDFAVSTNDNGIEFMTYEETPQKLAKVDFSWNKELFNPRCLLLVDRGALLNCSKHFWNEDLKKCETVVHFILLWMNDLRPKCGVSEKEWASTALIPSWRIWQVRQTYKAKSSQTTALTKPWWRSWKLQTNCGEQLSVCANERSLEDYEEGDENEQWDISSIVSAECAMAQSSRVCQLLAKIRCCKHSCGDHFPLQWWKVGDRRPFPWLSTFFLAAVDV